MGAEEKIVFERPHALLPVITNYCPGCPHGIVQRLVAETIDELDIEGDTIGVAPVGCAVTCPDFFGCDMVEAAHGRAPAVATGVKRVLPDSVVFAYQGDGDLASIGMAETIHAATRGEHITIIFINGRPNGSYQFAEPSYSNVSLWPRCGYSGLPHSRVRVVKLP